jgi:hypothetical protein
LLGDSDSDQGDASKDTNASAEWLGHESGE